MASTSGSVVTSPEQHQRSLTLTWSQTSQSIANNTTTISWTLKGSGSDSIYYYVTCRKIKVTINGTQAWYNAGEIDVNNQQTIATGTFDVPHNADGTKTFTIAVEASIYEVNINSSGSGSWTLATIPRYATVTQSLSSKTETSITMAWSSDSTCDYVWYKIGSGSWTGIAISAAKSGTYTITGRSANTAYTIYTRVRRKDSQLTTDSTGLSVTTYQYPYANSMPNFTIGNDVTIGIYNPLGRTVTLKMLAADDTTIATKTVTGTSVNGFNTSAMQTLLYNSIPSATSGTYKISCTYSSQTQTKTGGTYSVNASQCKPSIASATYVDANASTVAITGDSSKIVRTLSQVTFTGSSCAAQKGASVSSVSVSVNGSSYAMTLSGGAVKTATKTGVTINSGSNVTATITVTDSRGYTASASVTVKMVNWQLPTGIISLKRHDNYYSDTDLKCDASWTSIGSNTCTITYQCRIQGTSSWTITGTLSDNVPVTITLDNQSAWDVWVTLTDSFGGTTTYKLSLSRGMPIAYFDRLRSSVGIDVFPQFDGSIEASKIYENSHKMVYTADKTLTTTGWYTFLKYKAGNASQSLFSYPIIIDINILRVYQNGNNEAYRVRFVGTYNNMKFYPLNGRVNGNYITSIRAAKKSGDNTVYFQLYYNSSNAANAVCVDCSVFMTNQRIYLVEAADMISESCDTEMAKCALHTFESLATTSNYVQYPNGVMLQWGQTDLTSMTLSQIASSGVYFGQKDLELPVAFINTNYMVTGNTRYSTGHTVPFGSIPSTTKKVTIYVYDFYARSGTIVARWQAVGRWY